MLVRVNGVNAPEIRGKCKSEKERAKVARDYLKEVLGDRAFLRDVFLGKWAGRIVATVLNKKGQNVATLLIEGGYGVEYDGKSARQSWCSKKN